MTLEVRVLAAEFASVMGVSLRNLAKNGHRALYGVQISFAPEVGIPTDPLPVVIPPWDLENTPLIPTHGDRNLVADRYVGRPLSHSVEAIGAGNHSPCHTPVMR